MSAAPALLPCPFCGGSAIIYSERSVSDGKCFYYARCDGTKPDHCSTIMPPQIGFANDRDAVVAAWNRRPAPAPGLEEAVERCAKIAEDLDGKGGGYGDYPSGWDAACSRIASDIRALTRGDGRELGAATRLDDEKEK